MFVIHVEDQEQSQERGLPHAQFAKGMEELLLEKAPSIWKQNVQHVEERGKSSSILASLIKSEHAEERDLGILQLPKY